MRREIIIGMVAVVVLMGVVGPARASLSEALDTTIAVTTGGDADWFAQYTEYYYDEDAAQSGAIDDSQDSWMEMTVQGSGTLSFYWKVSSESGYDFLQFCIEGYVQDEISGEVDWQQKSYEVTGECPWTFRWQYDKDGSVSDGGDCGWVDMVDWTGAGVGDPEISGFVRTSEGSGIDGVTLTFSNGGGSTTTGTLGYYHHAVSSGWSGTVTPSKTDYSFDPPSRSYSNVTADVPNQDYTGTVPLCDALDTTLSIITGGDADWFGQYTEYYYDGDAGQSGDISWTEESWMETTVEGPGTARFYWKVSSQEYNDYLTFFVDGSIKYAISGEVDWYHVSYEITDSGPHTLKWEYN